jgi:TetR/AcrR family transcriptional regulator, transcriptional repressor for nem operon
MPPHPSIHHPRHRPAPVTRGAPSPPGGPRRQPPDVRREQILDAAARVLVERGLAATTMADVAEAASLAKGTVYLYFASKAELLAGLRARFLEGFAALLDPPAGSGPGMGVADRIERLVAAAYDFALANHELHHVLFHEAGFGEADAFTRIRAALAELIEEGLAAGELAVADPHLATDFVLQGLHGVLVAGVHGPAAGRERLVAGVTELTSRALGVAPRPAGGGPGRPDANRPRRPRRPNG